MMDAVTGLQPHRSAMSGSGERKSRGASVGTVKTEPQDEDAWKNLPSAGEAGLSAAARARAASPLQSKGGSVDDIAPSKTVGNGNGVVSSEAKPNPPAARQRVRSSTTQEKEKDSDKPSAPDDLDDAARKLHELDLYDFKDSSSSFTPSPADQQSHIPSAAKSSAPAPARSHRRHSSIPKETMKSSAAAIPVAAASDVERTKPSSSTSSSRTTSAASRRRSMMT
jgi:hypothetical protein